VRKNPQRHAYMDPALVPTRKIAELTIGAGKSLADA
jgi:hypothetical protein